MAWCKPVCQFLVIMGPVYFALTPTVNALKRWNLFSPPDSLFTFLIAPPHSPVSSSSAHLYVCALPLSTCRRLPSLRLPSLLTPLFTPRLFALLASSPLSLLCLSCGVGRGLFYSYSLDISLRSRINTRMSYCRCVRDDTASVDVRCICGVLLVDCLVCLFLIL